MFIDNDLKSRALCQYQYPGLSAAFFRLRLLNRGSPLSDIMAMNAEREPWSGR